MQHLNLPGLLRPWRPQRHPVSTEEGGDHPPALNHSEAEFGSEDGLGVWGQAGLGSEAGGCRERRPAWCLSIHLPRNPFDRLSSPPPRLHFLLEGDWGPPSHFVPQGSLPTRLSPFPMSPASQKVQEAGLHPHFAGEDLGPPTPHPSTALTSPQRQGPGHCAGSVRAGLPAICILLSVSWRVARSLLPEMG